MATVTPILIATVNILWLASPPTLTGLGLRDWKRKRERGRLRVELPLAVGMVLLTDWVLFVRFVIESATPYGIYFRPTWTTAALLLLSFLAAIASLAARMCRWQMALAGGLTMSLWIGIGYAPAHYLSRVDFASVSVDDHPVTASVYIGHPTDMEAEAYALVRLEQGDGNYVLSFDSEKVRPATRAEYVRIPGGVWYLRSIQRGTFAETLPPQRLNQFRVLSGDGHILTVQF